MTNKKNRAAILLCNFFSVMWCKHVSHHFYDSYAYDSITNKILIVSLIWKNFKDLFKKYISTIFKRLVLSI